MSDSEKQKNQFIKLRGKGISYQEISEQIHIPERKLINWGKELHMEINNANALELEALQDEFYLLKERRIKLFGEKLKIISEELENRDLGKIQTEKLFDLFFKMYKLLEKEAVEVKYYSEDEIKDNNEMASLTSMKGLK